MGVVSSQFFIYLKGEIIPRKFNDSGGGTVGVVSSQFFFYIFKR